MVGPTYIFTAYRQSQLNCHARTIQPHESALRKRACHSTRYVALERSNRSRVPDRQDNRRHASARQSRRQPCAIRRLFCSNHLQSADAQVKETMREPIPACPASTRYSHSNGVRTPTWMWYEILRPPQMRQECWGCPQGRYIPCRVRFRSHFWKCQAAKAWCGEQSSNMDPSVTIPLTS